MKKLFALSLFLISMTAWGADPKVIYPKHSEVDIEAAQIEGEIRNPGEFYFQHRKEEKLPHRKYQP